MEEYAYLRKASGGMLEGFASVEGNALKLVDNFQHNGKPANDELIPCKHISGIEIMDDHIFITVVGRSADIHLQMVFDEEANTLRNELKSKI